MFRSYRMIFIESHAIYISITAKKKESAFRLIWNQFESIPFYFSVFILFSCFFLHSHRIGSSWFYGDSSVSFRSLNLGLWAFFCYTLPKIGWSGAMFDNKFKAIIWYYFAYAFGDGKKKPLAAIAVAPAPQNETAQVLC